MNATTVAVDLANNVFEIAVADANWKVIEHQRLTRGQFERWFDNRSVRLVSWKRAVLHTTGQGCYERGASR